MPSVSDFENDTVEQSRMSFGEHLDELRVRVVRALGFFFVAFVGCFIYRQELLKIYCDPLFWVLRENGFHPALFPRTVMEVFWNSIEVAAVAGFVLSSPLVFYQIWAFVAAGLYRHEKRLVFQYGPVSLFCFLGGVLFFYFVVLPITLNFFVTFGADAKFDPTAGKPGTIGLFFPDRTAQDVMTPNEVTIPAMVDKVPCQITLDAERLPRVTLPVIDGDPAPEKLRPGMLWINRQSGDLRCAVRKLAPSPTEDFASALGGWWSRIIGGRDADDTPPALPAEGVWDIRTIPFQTGSVLAPTYTLDDYISFFTRMTLIFGFAFQVPLVVVFAVKLGVTDRAGLRGIRKYVLFGVVVLAAILTPTPDPATQMTLAVPMYLLYELGIVLTYFLGAPLVAFEEEPSPEGADGHPSGGAGTASAPQAGPEPTEKSCPPGPPTSAAASKPTAGGASTDALSAEPAQPPTEATVKVRDRAKSLDDDY